MPLRRHSLHSRRRSDGLARLPLQELPEAFRHWRHRERSVPTGQFRITKGAPKRYQDSATQSGRTLSRHFCAECGSSIYSQRNPDPGFVVVRAGSLDDSSGMKITSDIWTSTAPPWAYIDPSSERHPGNMPAPPQK